LREYLFASFYLPTLLSFCFCFRLFSGVYNVKEIGGIGAFDFGFFYLLFWICFVVFGVNESFHNFVIPPIIMY